eukprot:jgi/Picre1/28731/NNA_004131.t1
MGRRRIHQAYTDELGGCAWGCWEESSDAIHALSLCQTGTYEHVHMVGYQGARLIPELEEACSAGTLVTSYIPTTPAWMATSQWWDTRIPPAIPTMALCILASRVRGARLVFDWHNFAHTLMGGGVLSRIAKVYEKLFAPYADGHVCVTHAMAEVLKHEYRHTQATVFYDKPPRLFRGRRSSKEKRDLFETLRPCLREPMHIHDCLASMVESGVLRSGDDLFHSATEDNDARGHRVLVTSTSWTPDEDFGILLDAMVQYDALAQTSSHLPMLVLFVTGRGPQKAMYVQRMQSLDLHKVAIRTVWLEPEDYPVLLGSADVGISLHASSSSVDLPMKIVDMFGSHLPVCALSYPCLADEMVREGENGMLFTTSSELVENLQELFETQGKVARMMEYLERHPYGRWDDEWQASAWPIISGMTQ